MTWVKNTEKSQTFWPQFHMFDCTSFYLPLQSLTGPTKFSYLGYTAIINTVLGFKLYVASKQARIKIRANLEVWGSFGLCRGPTSKNIWPMKLHTQPKEVHLSWLRCTNDDQSFVLGIYCQAGAGDFLYRFCLHVTIFLGMAPWKVPFQAPN